MYLDDSYFALHTVHNGYELEKVFGIKAPMLSECFSEDVWAFILEEKKRGKSVPQTLSENGIAMGMILSGSAFCYLAALLNKNRTHIMNPTVRPV